MLLHGPTYAEAEQQFLSFSSVLVSKLTFPLPDTSVTTLDKEIFPGLKARIYTPSNYIPKSKPACVFFHGGGWTMGDLEGEDAFCRRASKDAGIVIVSVDYCLAPANLFPKPLDDCERAYYWCLENSEFLKTKKGKVVAFGTSAGGNLALSTALRVVDDGRRETLGGVIAVVPVTVAIEAVPERFREQYKSYDEHAEHTINTKMVMKMFFGELRANYLRFEI
jgi:versiconal hemiacetal acetate esterase